MIDDDPDDALFFQDALADLAPDTNFSYMQDGERAIEFLVQCRRDLYPDVIFMDISMPTMNGWDCLREIKKIMYHNRIPIVMFSTLNFKLQELSPSDVGATAFLTKADSMWGLKKNLTNLFNTLFPEL